MTARYTWFFWAYVLALLGSVAACKKDPEAEPGFFLRASPIVLDTDSLQGSGSHGICDIWLYVNGQFQGAYPVGNLMPIISQNQNVRIEAFAGIKNNGIDGTRIYWQLYSKLNLDTLVQQGVQVTRSFHFQYNPAVNFLWVEGFEGNAGVSLIKSPISETGYAVLPAGSGFEGRSIEMRLNSSQIIGQLESTLSYPLPQANSNVYLELNYRCNAEIIIGIFGSGTGDKEVIRLNPKTEWNKIYIRLADVVNMEPKASSYKVYFQMLNQGSDIWMQLDNIKLVHL